MPVSATPKDTLVGLVRGIDDLFDLLHHEARLLLAIPGRQNQIVADVVRDITPRSCRGPQKAQRRNPVTDCFLATFVLPRTRPQRDHVLHDLC